MTTVKTSTDETPSKSTLSSSSSSSSSDSDGSDSSSDSDTSSAASSAKAKPPQNDKPQFSVMSSDSAGLRMKIAIPRNQLTTVALTNIKPINNVNNANKNSKNSNEECGGDGNCIPAATSSNNISNSTNNKATNSNDVVNEAKPKVANNKQNTTNSSTNNQKSDSSSDSSCFSTDYSDSDSDSSTTDHKKDPKVKAKFVKRKKANRGGSTSSGGATESSESESSDEALQEFNPDDLDEILPKDFNETVSSNNASISGNSKPISTSTPAKQLCENAELQDHDGASSSDMELPALVNAAIQRVECESDAESSRTTPATSHYTSSLLRDFVVKTQMLGSSVLTTTNTTSTPATTASITKAAHNKDLKTEVDIRTIKTESPVPPSGVTSLNGIVAKTEVNVATIRKRGRPLKIPPTANNLKAVPISESPDSGILSTHSPTCSPKTDKKVFLNNQKKKSEADTDIRINSNNNSNSNSNSNSYCNSNSNSNCRISKYTIASLERSTYATERTLYPPRGKKKGPGRPPKEKPLVTSPKDDTLDPIWRKIDISKKFQEPQLSGYKSDGGHSICCSKRLAAQSGYVSEYGGSCGRNKLSGYKTDHSAKSRKSVGGYKSDYGSKAKSCGYRSDCSVRHRKQVRKKRRKKVNVQSNNNNFNNKNYNQNNSSKSSSVSEQDILQLAGLTLGSTSEECNSSRDSILIPPANQNKTVITNNMAKNLNIVNSNQQTPAPKITPLLPVNNFNGLFSTINKFNNKYTFSSSNINSKNSFAAFLKSNRIKDNGKIVKKLPLSKANVIKNSEELNKKFQKSTFSLSSGATSTSRDILSNLCERVSKRITGTDLSKVSPAKSVCSKKTRRKSDNLDKLETTSMTSRINLLDKIKDQPKINFNSIRARRMSTMSRCSSRSAGSKHFKRRRKRRLNSRSNSVSSTKNTETKMNVEIEKLSDSFNSLCKINADKANEAKGRGDGVSTTGLAVATSNIAKAPTKRSTKKRKASEHIESPSITATGTKRRNKKSVPTQSPDEHKLPLKKRHYLLTPGEKNNDSGAEKDDHKVVNPISMCMNKSSGNTTTNVKDSSKAVTPKKRHLLKSPEHVILDEILEIKSSDSPLTIDPKVSEQSDPIPAKKNDIITRKKNRLEGLVSKIQPTATVTAILADNNILAASNKNLQSERPSVIQTPAAIGITPPPGIFEPSVDLELQIPALSLPSLITKVEMLDSPRLKDTITKLEIEESSRKTSEKVVERLFHRTAGHLLLKKKRKKINRTGFPTVKKKKKKPVEKEIESIDTKPPITLNLEPLEESVLSNHVTLSLIEKTKPQNCDRVPKEGETTDRFIERNSRPRLSVVSLERLQGKLPLIPTEPPNLVATRGKKAQEEGEKRLLREKSSKRDRDSSLDTNKSTKKTKKDSPKIFKKELEKVKVREDRDGSSDNEPLISYVKPTDKLQNKNNKNKENNTVTLTPMKKLMVLVDGNLSPRLRSTRSASIALDFLEVRKQSEKQMIVNNDADIMLKTAVIKLQSCLLSNEPPTKLESLALYRRARSKSICKTFETTRINQNEDENSKKRKFEKGKFSPTMTFDLRKKEDKKNDAHKESVVKKLKKDIQIEEIPRELSEKSHNGVAEKPHEELAKTLKDHIEKKVERVRKSRNLDPEKPQDTPDEKSFEKVRKSRSLDPEKPQETIVEKLIENVRKSRNLDPEKLQETPAENVRKSRNLDPEKLQETPAENIIEKVRKTKILDLEKPPETPIEKSNEKVRRSKTLDTEKPQETPIEGIVEKERKTKSSDPEKPQATPPIDKLMDKGRKSRTLDLEKPLEIQVEKINVKVRKSKTSDRETPQQTPAEKLIEKVKKSRPSDMEKSRELTIDKIITEKVRKSRTSYPEKSSSKNSTVESPKGKPIEKVRKPRHAYVEKTPEEPIKVKKEEISEQISNEKARNTNKSDVEKTPEDPTKPKKLNSDSLKQSSIEKVRKPRHSEVEKSPEDAKKGNDAINFNKMTEKVRKSRKLDLDKSQEDVKNVKKVAEVINVDSKKNVSQKEIVHAADAAKIQEKSKKLMRAAVLIPKEKLRSIEQTEIQQTEPEETQNTNTIVSQPKKFIRDRKLRQSLSIEKSPEEPKKNKKVVDESPKENIKRLRSPVVERIAESAKHVKSKSSEEISKDKKMEKVQKILIPVTVKLPADAPNEMTQKEELLKEKKQEKEKKTKQTTAEKLQIKKVIEETLKEKPLQMLISEKPQEPKLKVKKVEKAPVRETITELDSIQPADLVIELEHDPLPENEGSIPKISREECLSPSVEAKNRKYQRKKYLMAGLFSDCYKDDSKTLTKGLAKYVPETLLPAPMYCEKFLRRTERDFELPFDLWWANENGKLPGRDAVPSWNYRKIRTNVYCDVKPNPSSDHQQCSCKPDSCCPDYCLNRLVYAECSTETCPCGDKCQNTKIQRHEYAPGLERFMTTNKGWGVRSKEEIRRGTFIMEYLGEVVTEREFKERMRTLYLNDTHHYCLNLDGGLVIDGHRMGSDGRFVNHSCAPNCEMQKWSVNGLFRMALFASRNIEPYEELTYDYNFSLFNPSEGQPCKCGSVQCRGVIGGKSQRIKPISYDKGLEMALSPATLTANQNRRKRQARKNQPLNQIKYGPAIPVFHLPTPKEKYLIIEHQCFLLRNLNKIRKLKERMFPELMMVPSCSSPAPTGSSTLKPSLSAQISALRVPRNIRTRGLAQVEHDPELEKTARVAIVLKEICHSIGSFRDENNVLLCTKLQLPSKKKCPLYYERIPKPIDLTQITSNVENGVYSLPKLFGEDMLVMFGNAVKYFGINSVEGIASERLKSHYHIIKAKSLEKLVLVVGGDNELLKGFAPKTEKEYCGKPEPHEDIIRCICGLYKDEGLMIQCSRCLVWQHIECTKADPAVENYMCEKCEDKVVNYEIPLNEYTDEGYQYYLSLMRGDLQIRQTDTVYVLRDIPMTPDSSNPNEPVKKHTYETIGEVDYAECDIFRVESLWKNNEGKRFAYGHHYLRPHETYHEPSRKFYPNEVVRVPLYEVVPIELIIDRCWVLDTATFCKGRPADSSEPHVYICELRVDKSARLFAKISRQAHPVCTKNYAFHKFEQKLKIYKTFAPHDLGSLAPAMTNRKKIVKKEEGTNTSSLSVTIPATTTIKKPLPIVQLLQQPKTLHEKRNRVEDILTRLMYKLNANPNAVPPVDISYLLTGRGARLRRTNNSTPVPV